MPFAPSSRRVSRATSVAILTLFRLASDTCCGVTFPWSLSRPSCRLRSCALVISVSISASRACCSWKPPIGLPNITRVLRSEEHTSELQSHSDLVCRLLLQKQDRHPRTVLRDPVPGRTDHD